MPPPSIPEVTVCAPTMADAFSKLGEELRLAGFEYAYGKVPAQLHVRVDYDGRGEEYVELGLAPMPTVVVCWACKKPQVEVEACRCLCWVCGGRHHRDYCYDD